MNIYFNFDLDPYKDEFGTICGDILGRGNRNSNEYILLGILFSTSERKTLSGVCDWIVELYRMTRKGINVLYEYVIEYEKTWDIKTSDPYITHFVCSMWLFFMENLIQRKTSNKDLRSLKYI